ncbi:hypothetical protein NBRC116494_02360 [Aurantivibrio plasticivorans]
MIPQSQVSTQITSNKKGLVIAVEGYFNGALHAAFRESFEGQPKFERYAVSLQHCLGLDSGGLGLLLVLRDYSGLGKENLLLTQIPPEIKTVLRYANFDQIFTIVE